MKSIIAIFALFVLAIPCKGAAQKHVLPLNEVNNRTHVAVTIDGIVIPHILIDTGFPFDGVIIYNPNYRDSLDLSNAMDVQIPGAGGGEPSRGSMIDSATFYLGEIAMHNQRIITLESDTYKGFASNGIIGYSIFGHYITEFNYDNNTITLYDSDTLAVDDSWADVPLYFKGNNIPWIDASVVIADGPPVSLAMNIDYAAGDVVLLLEKPDMKFKLPMKTEDTYIGRGLSGDIYGKTGYIRKLIIGPYVLENVKASIADARIRSKQKNADAILGVGAMRRFNLIFDYNSKKLYVKPNRHFNEPF